MFSLNVPVKYSNTVYNTIRPLYISSRLFGYSPFSATITKPSSNKIYLTKLDHFIFIIHVLAYIFCVIFNLNAEIHDNMSSSKLLVNGTKAQIVFGCFGCCIIVVVELVFRTYYWQIVESLNEFDIELQTMGKTINHSKHKKFIEHFLKLWCLIFSVFTIYSFIISLNYGETLRATLFVISLMLINGTFGSTTNSYSFFILSLKVRFAALNDCLRDESQSLSRIKVIQYNNQEDSVHKIVKIAQLHDKLTDTMQLVNQRFSFQVMVLVAAEFIFSVFSLYGLYRACNSAFVNEFLQSTLHMMWAFYYDFFILTVIWLGSSVRSEGTYTGALIHKIINNCPSSHAIEKLSLFSQQLNHQVPIATCKLFPFDWTLLFTIVGAITTYLTILIQFDSFFDGKSNIVNITTSQ